MAFFRRACSAKPFAVVLALCAVGTSAVTTSALAQAARTAPAVPLPRPRPYVPPTPPWMLPVAPEPRTFKEAAGPDFDGAGITAKPTDCNRRLEKIATIELIPRLVGPGTCGGGDIVRLDAVLIAGGKRVEVKAAPHLRCPMAEQLALWLREDAVPRVAAAGAELRALEVYESFECRGRNRKMLGKVSEHGKANAVDLKGFTFTDNRYFHLTDLMAAKDLRTSIRESICVRFSTVLGPGSDGYHEEHIHLDQAERRNNFRICQWAVLEPPPPPPPKPEQKPAPKEGEQAALEPEQEADEEALPAAAPITGPVPLPRPRPANLEQTRRLQRRL